jgi:hypothetical protein
MCRMTLGTYLAAKQTPSTHASRDGKRAGSAGIRRITMNSSFLTYVRRSNGDPSARKVRLTPAVVEALRA